ncbi:NMRAL1 protein [Aspergillus novofumigatus IBT 16806]|uniref:NMRAL1 protein n=1 Tax=Aspergillus novofumigatus (strain IBT 16806) TaxID=1392255 RepID=A0A2I1BTY7_ASPN1|nr:NMRAL1 protein [Aspergillus novofumigatus IBT 16806]PKX88867.1 NMRAL1 protein [Aspergillus novofumigatus IBT 16806]
MPETASIPLFDVHNTGIWVKAIVRKRDQLLGKRILGATKYTTPKKVVKGFKQAFPEADSIGLPDWAAESILEIMRLINKGRYFGFKLLEESLAVDFLKKHKGFKDLK